ncbi:hypothetical protein D3C72_1814200 [compost metagenome]
MPATMRRTYSREPPCTVFHCGRSSICIRPWLAQKSKKVEAGKAAMSRVELDQIAAPIGSRYQSRSAALKR